MKNGMDKMKEQRFIDNGDSTVTDNKTGLMWAKDGNAACNQMDMEEALSFISKLNDSKTGYKDWRLPTIQELSTLTDSDQRSPALPLNHPFSNVQSGSYWSLSPSPEYVKNSGDFVWSMDMAIGSTGLNEKSHKLYVWPVRGKWLFQ